MATIPIWVPPLPAAATLNQQRRSEQQIIAEGAPLPIPYGRQQYPGKIFAIQKDSGTWYLGVAWCLGEVESVTVYLNGAAPVAGATVVSYIGALSQDVDATLAGVISGYADNLVLDRPGGQIGVCYSVISYTDDHYPSFPQCRAQIEGLNGIQLTSSPTYGYSRNPSRCTFDFITNDIYGMGENADFDSFDAVADDNDETGTVLNDVRRRLDLGLETPLPAIEWVKILAGYMSAWVYRIGDTWYASSDRPRSADVVLNEGDWRPKSFGTQIADKNRVPTRVEVEYTDTNETIWRPRIASYELTGVSNGTVPRRVSRVKMPGITRYSQAYREAVERCKKLQRGAVSVSFSGYDDQLVRTLGDVLDLSRGSHLLNDLFRLSAPPRRDGNGTVLVQASAYSPDDYDDSEPAEPTFGANDGFQGDGNTAEPGATVGASENSNVQRQVWRSEDWGDNDVSRWQAFRGPSADWPATFPAESELSVVASGAGNAGVGGYALRIGNNSGNDMYWGPLSSQQNAVPITTGKLYRMTIIVGRQAGTGTFYAGPFGLKGDVRNGNGTLVNSSDANSWSGQHYFAAAAASPSGWTRYTTYFTKDGVAYNNSPAGTLNAPKVLHPAVQYVVPGIIVNYSSVAGTYDIDFCEIVEVSGDDFGALADLDEVGQYEIELHAALRSAVATYNGTAINILTTSFTECETVGLTLPATITDSIVQVDGSFEAYITITTAGVSQNGVIFEARLLDDDNNPVGITFIRAIRPHRFDVSTTSQAAGSISFTGTWLVPTSQLNANEENTFKLQCRLQTTSGLAAAGVQYIALRATLMNQAED